MDNRLLNICRFFIPPSRSVKKIEIHWPTFYIPHFRDEAILPDRRPRVRFLNGYLGFSVTAKERDAAWKRAKDLGNYPLSGRDYDIIFGYYFDDA